MSEREAAERQDLARGPAGRDEISLVTVVSTLLRHRYLILGLQASLVAIVALLVLTSPRTYTAHAAFVPQRVEDSQSRFAGLAAQAGFSLPRQDVSQSPEFYRTLLNSREVLGEVVRRDYSVVTESGARDATLIEFLGIEDDDPETRLKEATRDLRSRVRVETSPSTSVIDVYVSTEWVDLSEAVAANLVDAVQRFNVEKRQSQAAAEREFIEARLTEARSALRNTEDALESWLEQNRSWQEAPALVFEHDRLQRRVATHQQVVTTLVQALEQARLEQVRNTPLITIIDSPAGSGRPDRRGLILKAVVAAVVAFGLGAIIALSISFFEQARKEGREDVAELVETLRESKDWLRRLRPAR